MGGWRLYRRQTHPGPSGLLLRVLKKKALHEPSEVRRTHLCARTIDVLMERVMKVAGGLKAILDGACQGLSNDGLENIVQIRSIVPWRRIDDGIPHPFEDGEVVFAREQSVAGQELEEDDAGGEDVCTMVDLGARDLFGRHVSKLPLQYAGDRLLASGRLGDAEVADLHLTLKGQEDVGGGHVPMNDAQRTSIGTGETVCVLEAP